MLTRLRLKNWRSCKDVTIDFTPLTVLIGVNASGKSNILEALEFLRWALSEQDIIAVGDELDRRKVFRIGSSEPLEIEIDFKLSIQTATPFQDFRYNLRIGQSSPISIEENLTNLTTGKIVTEGKNGGGNFPIFPQLSIRSVPSKLLLASLTSIIRSAINDDREHYEWIENFISTRWQFLGENFAPQTQISSTIPFERYLIDQSAQNTVLMLDFMQRQFDEIYQQFRTDIREILRHVSSADVISENDKTRLSIRESSLNDTESPTISAGTARIAAILTACYALDMRSPEQPGLVAIEEPDSAINPGLLGVLAGRLRGFTENPDKPRQVILTTHNPILLDFVEPEEVRVVSRDDEGNTIVTKPDADAIREIWLETHTLGEVWSTNSLGGWE